MYAIARNATGRPTLQHEQRPGQIEVTLCGVDMSGWSRTYQPRLLGNMLCGNCKRAAVTRTNVRRLLSLAFQA